MILKVRNLKKLLVCKPIYLDRYKKIGEIVDVDHDTDSIYGEVMDGEYTEMLLDSKGYNMCTFELVQIALQNIKTM